MGRHRRGKIALPNHVHEVRAGAKRYFYYQKNRNTPQAGPRSTIHGDPYARADAPANLRFWAELNLILAGEVAYPAGSVGEIVRRYRADDAYLKLSERTREVYDIHLNRMAKPAAWGFAKVGSLTPEVVRIGRDGLKDTPGMANQMLSVGRTLYAWALPLGHAHANPFESVGNLDVPDRGHVPWPRWAIDHMLAHASQDLVRLVRLGLMTCQRESDLIRMGPVHRERNGIWCRPKKTKRRRRSFCIPLATVDALELDRWAKTPITFENSRWKKPIARFRDDLYLYTPRGKPYATTSLRARYQRWLRTPAGKDLCKRWRAWIAGQVKRYEWDLDPEEMRNPTVHGLRGAGILLRWADGYDVDQISNDIGMSKQMVEHYMRFKDQLEVAEGGRGRLRIVDRD
jgi:hypothetical protein